MTPTGKSEFLKIDRDAADRVTKSCCDAFRALLEEQIVAAQELLMARFTSMRRGEYGEITATIKVKIQE
jgi:hypothetical protein